MPKEESEGQKAARLEELEDEVKDLSDDILMTTRYGRSLEQSPGSVGMFQARLSYLHSAFERFLKALSSAKSLARTLKRPTEAYDNTRAEVRTLFYEALTYEKSVVASSPLETTVVPKAEEADETFTLPIINLSKFDGSLSEWPSFKDTFLSLIHNNNKVSPIKKFHYLKSILQGSAKQAISNIPVTAGNYAQAWATLNKKYDNLKLQATHYVSKILSFKPLVKTDLSSLENLSDVVIESITSLRALQLPDESGFILLNIVLRLLDVKMRERFDAEHKGKDTLPTYDDLVDFIFEQCLARQTEKLLKGTVEPSVSVVAKKPTHNVKRILLSHEKRKTTNSCPICHEKHALYKCRTFLTLTPIQRLARVKAFHFCINCLSSKHMLDKCTSESSCRKCMKRHNTLLHFEEDTSQGQASFKTRPPETPKTIQSTPTGPDATVLSASTCGKNYVVLGTAIVRARDKNGEFQPIRLVVDCGSQRSFITTELAKKLDLKMSTNPDTLCGFGDSPIQGATYQMDCVICPMRSSYPHFQARCIVIPQITNKIPLFPLPRKIEETYKGYDLSDPHFWKPSSIDLLLGADLFGKIFLGECLSFSEHVPNLMKTVFGWVVIGPCHASHFSEGSAVTLLSVSNIGNENSLDHIIKKFWEMDEVPKVVKESPEDELSERHCLDTHRRDETGRYIVRLPFKPNVELDLSESPQRCLQRFYKLEQKLNKTPLLKTEYSKIIRNYLDRGYIAPATDKGKYYLPHHCVIKDSTSTKVAILTLTQKTTMDVQEIITRFSSFPRLLRVFSYMRRFISSIRGAPIGYLGPPNLTELRSSELELIKLIQRHNFPPPLDKVSRVQSLAPFVDHLGVIRVGGRLRHSSLPHDAKHPIILPAKSPFTSLLVDHFHSLYLHAGPQLLHSILQRRYWILSARRVIRSRIRKCLTCHKLRATAVAPLMADLPRARFEQGRPFINTGVDFAGPFLTKDSKRRKSSLNKSYLALFVCLSTKAIHVEVVTQMTTDCFLAAFDRFVARRGLPHTVFSDHGTNFIGAKRHFKELYEWYTSSENQKMIKQHLLKRDMQWQLIPPHAPHFGGLWEAGVKSFKAHFVRVVGNLCLTYEELNTVATRIEAMLNSRPLYPLSSSPDDLDILTPGHFLVGAPLVCPPEEDLTNIITNRLTRWQLLNRVIQDIWKRWRLDYLNNLQQRVKWRNNTESMKLGTLMLLREPRARGAATLTVPPLTWPTGRVIQIHPGKDGVVRVVTLKTAKGVYTRPVTNLIPLLPPRENDE